MSIGKSLQYKTLELVVLRKNRFTDFDMIDRLDVKSFLPTDVRLTGVHKYLFYKNV